MLRPYAMKLMVVTPNKNAPGESLRGVGKIEWKIYSADSVVAARVSSGRARSLRWMRAALPLRPRR